MQSSVTKVAPTTLYRRMVYMQEPMAKVGGSDGASLGDCNSVVLAHLLVAMSRAAIKGMCCNSSQGMSAFGCPGCWGARCFLQLLEDGLVRYVAGSCQCAFI